MIASNADLKADERVCGLSAELASAGESYYDKMLRRHIALRTLIPENRGKRKYTLKGDLFPKLIRYYPTSIIERRDLCKSFTSSPEK